MAADNSFYAGFAEIDFTPPPGMSLLGQLHQRIAESTRDPLLCCGLAMRQGEETAVVVSVDVALMATVDITRARQEWERRSGLPASSLLIHTTHTHVAPIAFQLMEEVDQEFLTRLLDCIVQCAQDAVSNFQPVQLYAGTGHMEHMGWNRRAKLKDGTSRMYAHSEMPEFSEIEGPRDPALPVLTVRNEADDVLGILVNFATHPNSIESACVYSADVPGEVRRNLKKLYGEKLRVVYLTGASGNTAPSVLDPYDATQPWRGEAGLVRSGQYLAGEAAKVIASSIKPMVEPQLRLLHTTLDIPIRPWPQPGEPTYYRFEGNAYYERCAQEWPRHLAQNNPVSTRINVLRIGDAVICTNPAELFVEFGLELREVSPAQTTFISSLTDGYVGYVPTEQAFVGGGYETWCALTSQLEPCAGGDIVSATRTLLEEAFAD